jgi:hypothetical protein
MKLDGILIRRRELPGSIIGFDKNLKNLRFVVDNQFSKDINMWVKCSDESKVLIYATEGES